MATDVIKALSDKLETLDSRCREIKQQLEDPEICADPAKLIPLSREQGKLMPIISKYRKYKSCLTQIDDAHQMIREAGADAEMKAMAEEEAATLEQTAETLIDEIKDTLVMADDAAIDSIIVEIRPGTGGDEAGLFARDLFNMYTRYAEKQGWKTEVMEFAATEMGGLREVIVNIKGSGVWAQLGYEGGGHRVQRVPETESQGRVHTSAATVAVLPEAEEVDVSINPDDVLEHVSCAGGPGGQNVNKVATAVQLRFDAAGSSSLPERVRLRAVSLAGQRATKDGVIVIEANRFRTQEQNRADARARLVELLAKAAEPPPKPRKKTRPSRGAVERRLKAKAGRSGIKKMRGKITSD